MKNTKKTLATAALQSTAQLMFADGATIREIAQAFGVSYEWTRRVVTGVRYAY